MMMMIVASAVSSACSSLDFGLIHSQKVWFKYRYCSCGYETAYMKLYRKLTWLL